MVVLHPEIAFANIRAVAETEEALWVLDDSPPFVTRVGRENESIMRGGERGEGPADFSLPVALQGGPNRGLGSHLGYREPALRCVRSNPRISPLGGDPRRRLGRDDRTSGRRRTSIPTTHGSPGTMSSSYTIRPPCTALRTCCGGPCTGGTRTLRPRNELVRFSDYAGPETADALEFAAFPLWDACGPGLVVWDPLPGELAWLDGGGAPTATIPLGGRGPGAGRYGHRGIPGSHGPLGDRPGLHRSGDRLHGRGEAGTGAFLGPGALCHSIAVRRCPDRMAASSSTTEPMPLGRGRRWLRFDKAGTSETIEFPRAFRLLAVTPQRVLGAYEGLEAEEGQRLAEWKNPWNIP